MMDVQRMLNGLVAPTSGTKTPSTTASLPPRSMSKNPFRDYQVEHDELPDQLYHVGPNVGLGGYSVKAPSQEIPRNIKQSMNDHRSVTGKENTCWITAYPDRGRAEEETNKQSVSSGKVHVVFVIDSTQLGNVIIVSADDDGSELHVFGEIPEKAFISIVKTTPTANRAEAAKGSVVEEFFDAEDGNDVRGPSSERSPETRCHGLSNSKNKKQAAPAVSDAKEASSSTRAPQLSKPFAKRKGKGISRPSGDDDDSGNDSPDRAKRPPSEKDANAPTAVPEDEWRVVEILFDESRRVKSLGPPTNKLHYLVEWASDEHGGWKPSWENKDTTLFVKPHHISEYKIKRDAWAVNATVQGKKMKSVLFREERGEEKDKKAECLVDWTIAAAPEWKSEDEVPLKLQKAYEKREGAWAKVAEKRKQAFGKMG